MGWFRNLGSERPWAQGCVIAGAATVLAATSCFGFLVTLDMNSGTSKLGEVATIVIALIFGLSALAIPAGVIWFIVGLVRNASKDGLPPPSSPSPPSPPSPPPPPPAGAGGPG